MHTYSKCRLIAGLIVFSILGFQNYSLGQLNNFKKSREWADSTGKVKKQASLLGIDDDIVSLQGDDGQSFAIPVEKLSRKDQLYVERYCEKALENLAAESKQMVYAKEVLELYHQYVEEGFVNKSNRILIESKIETLQKQTEINAIVLPNGFATAEDIESQKDRAKAKIDSWVVNVGSAGDAEKDQKSLRLAIKESPTSIDGAILLAIYHETHNGEMSVAQRHLDDAVDRGLRYLPIASEFDKHNLVAALNNLAASYARNNKVAKALKTWVQAREVPGVDFPPEAQHNVAKVLRMIQSHNSGIKADRTTQNNLKSFAVESGATGRSGGWRYVLPVDRDGNQRANIQFCIAEPSAQKLTSQSNYSSRNINEQDPRFRLRPDRPLAIDQTASPVSNMLLEDARCVKCRGVSQLPCPSKVCRKGAVPQAVYGNVYLTLPDGTRKKSGERIIRIDQIKCKTCSGDDLVDCPCCNGGIQRN